MEEIVLRCKNCDLHTFTLTIREPFLFIHEELAAMNECPECETLTEYDLQDADTINYKCENCGNIVPGVMADEDDDASALSLCVECSEQTLFYADRSKLA